LELPENMFFRKQQRVICIGSTSKDIFFPTGEGIVLETPEDLTAQRKIAFELGGKYRVDDRYEAVGGVAANVAQALVKLGITSSVYSNIGRDEIGRWILSELKTAGVSTEMIVVDPESKSDLSAIIVMTQNGERTIFHNRDANEKLEIVPKKLTGHEWVFVSALNGDWKANLQKITEAARKDGMRMALNPGQHNLRDDAYRILKAAAEAELLVLNKDEALELVMKAETDASPEELNDERFLLSALHRAGASIIGMTDGARGAWGSDGKEIWHCPIGHVEHVVDSTGAGDAFSAAFFAGHLLGKSLPDMLRYGIAESGSVVTEYGANRGLLSVADIESRIAGLVPERI
jgi:2-dehydro-3-deoxygluconokinase